MWRCWMPATSRAFSRLCAACGQQAEETPVAAALKVAEQAPGGSTFVVILPDTGERYLSSPLFADITEDSDDAWLAEQG